VRGGYVLYLSGGSDWRDLYLGSVSRDWSQDYVVGFRSE
jgi:hypothetical protein